MMGYKSAFLRYVVTDRKSNVTAEKPEMYCFYSLLSDKFFLTSCMLEQTPEEAV
jgi:hypothetical protein